MASPPRAAKQGRGIELVPGGNQDPRLTEPQRDSCQRQLTDEVQVPLAEPFSNEKVTLCFVTRYRATPHPPFGHLPLEGKAKSGRAARLAEQTGFAPNTETFSAVHKISVGYLSRLARSPGVSGGRSRIEFIVSPLLRRRHNESHFAAQSPERSFFF